MTRHKVHRTPAELRELAARIFDRIHAGASMNSVAQEFDVTLGLVSHHLTEERKRRTPLPILVCDLNPENRYRLNAVGYHYGIPLPSEVKDLPSFRESVLAKVRTARRILNSSTEGIRAFSDIVVDRLNIHQRGLIDELIDRIIAERS